MQTARPRHSNLHRNIAAQWHALYRHYPGSALVLTVAIMAALLADLTIVFQQYRLTHEEAQLTRAISRAEQQRSALVQQAGEDLTQARALLPRRDALVPKALHLSVDRRQGVMYLMRDRAILREMPVYLGRELAAKPGDPAPPLKTRRVQRLGDPPATVPAEPAPPAAGEPGPKEAAPLAFELTGGLQLYSLAETALPEENPPPTGVRLDIGDLAALKEALHPGLRVYFY